ncbi:MAG: glycosyltransferase family 39 protein [Chloroflexota bacterium]|nr:glycosyltransferase family 39 protein [Chloroflexota bacterium]
MKQKHREWLLLLLILSLAAGLRLTRLDLVEFKYDEATWARSALAILHEGNFPALGMVSSLGPYHPPLMSYILVLPFALSRDPRLAAGWVALLGVAAVALTWWVGRAYFGRRVGLLAALLFAACPWAVIHSRKTWTQNRAALTLLFIAAALALAARRKPWALAAALAAIGLLVSMHLGGMAFLFMLLLLALFFRRSIRPAPLLTGLMAIVLILSPYLLYEVRHDWPNLRGLANLAGQEATLDLQAPRMAALIVGGYHLQDLAGERFADFLNSIPDLRWLDQVEMALLWIGLAWLIYRVGREAWTRSGRLSPDGAARLVLLCWFAVPIALLLRHTAPLHPHDLNLLYPVQHLIIALFLVDVMDWGKRNRPQVSHFTFHVSRFTFYVSSLFAVMLISWHVYLQQSLLTFVDAHDTPGGYGAPVKYTLAAARRAEELQADMEDAELITLLPGADPRYDGQAAVFDVLLGPVPRPVDGRQTLVFPARPAVYLADPGAEPALTMLSEMGAEVEPPLPLRTGSDAAYRFFRCQPAAVSAPHPWEGDADKQHPLARWASGVTLLGYDWSGDPQPGGAVRWTLYWRVEGIPPVEGGLHWFNHLVDGEGVRWGQMDGVGLPISEWRVGDVVLTWFDITIDEDAPPPPYFVRSGMYTYPDIVTISLLDVAGNPAGQFVELPMNNDQ